MSIRNITPFIKKSAVYKLDKAIIKFANSHKRETHYSDKFYITKPIQSFSSYCNLTPMELLHLIDQGYITSFKIHNTPTPNLTTKRQLIHHVIKQGIAFGYFQVEFQVDQNYLEHLFLKYNTKLPKFVTPETIEELYQEVYQSFKNRVNQLDQLDQIPITTIALQTKVRELANANIIKEEYAIVDIKTINKNVRTNFTSTYLVRLTPGRVHDFKIWAKNNRL